MSNVQILKDTFQPALDSHLAKFPSSRAGFITSGISDKVLAISTTIFNKEMHGCTIHNDPFHTIFSVYQTGEDAFELTCSSGLGLLINPRPNESHLAYSIEKIPFRKVKGNAAKILAKLDAIQAQQLELVKKFRSEIKNFDQSNLKDLY